MISEKYFYFGINPASADGAGTSTTSMLFTNHADQTTITLTTANFYNPIPSSADVIKNGLIEVFLTTVHNDGSGDVHQFGTYYGSPADTTAGGGAVRIHPNALVYDGTNKITIKTVAQDAVYGITDSTTANHNDYEVVLAKPYIDGHAIVRPASRFLGCRLKDNDETQLHFCAGTYDAAADDIVTIKHKVGEFPTICRMMANLVNDETRQGQVIKVVDALNVGVESADKFSVVSGVGKSAGILRDSTGLAFNLDS